MKIPHTVEFYDPSVGGMQNRNRSPKVSVVMSVYNAEQYLSEAIESILNQTFRYFEFIIVDDGSTDRSKKIIESYEDSRITLISRANKGLTYSLNQGIKMAKGEYIARMDADDVSIPQRLGWEVEFMDKNPEIGMVGSNYIIIDETGKRIGKTDVFTHPEDLKVALVVANQFGHGSVMMRRAMLDKVGEYDPEAPTVEDYDLWTRISRVAKIANLREPLYIWRRSKGGISLSNQKLQLESTQRIIHREFRYLLENRLQYKIFTSWHPWKLGYLSYFGKKSYLFRDLAYYFRIYGKVWWAYLALVLAILLAPWRIRNYYYLSFLYSLEKVKKNWRYVYL